MSRPLDTYDFDFIPNEKLQEELIGDEYIFKVRTYHGHIEVEKRYEIESLESDDDDPEHKEGEEWKEVLPKERTRRKINYVKSIKKDAITCIERYWSESSAQWYVYVSWPDEHFYVALKKEDDATTLYSDLMHWWM